MDMFSIRSDLRIYRRKIQQEPTIETIENGQREDGTEAEELPSSEALRMHNRLEYQECFSDCKKIVCMFFIVTTYICIKACGSIFVDGEETTT
jgi:hypothetical protein